MCRASFALWREVGDILAAGFLNEGNVVDFLRLRFQGTIIGFFCALCVDALSVEVKSANFCFSSSDAAFSLYSFAFSISVLLERFCADRRHLSDFRQ